MRRAAVALVLGSRAALAHAGKPLAPHDFWQAWTFDPGIVLPLIAAAFLYWRGYKPERGPSPWQARCFWAGLVFLVIALVSPIHSWGEALFSAHMTQHEILMVLAAPLLVLGRPLVPFLWGLPLPWRKALGSLTKSIPVQHVWGALTRPSAAWLVHAIVLWGWHLPWLFQATLENDLVHACQHISFLGSALLFWWSLLYSKDGRAGYGTGVLYVFTTAVHTSLLGALLTYSPSVWYPAYAERTAVWGLTPIQDQQIGGLIMWVPAGLVYVLVGGWMLVLWLKESERLTAMREQGSPLPGWEK